MIAIHTYRPARSVSGPMLQKWIYPRGRREQKAFQLAGSPKTKGSGKEHRHYRERSGLERPKKKKKKSEIILIKLGTYYEGNHHSGHWALGTAYASTMY